VATIWFVQQGSPRKGKRVAELDFQWCINELGLHRDLWLPSARKAFIREPKAGDPGASGVPQRIFVELKRREAKGLSDKGWRSGYYLVVMPVSAVKSKLEADLGHDQLFGGDPHGRSIHASKKTWKT
jgi:hypothetical protein